MRFLTFIFLTVLLSACTTTPNKLRDSDPVFESYQRIEASTFANCVVEKWENLDYLLYSPVVNIHESSSGYEITQYLDGVLTHLADIERADAGSKVTIYTESLSLGDDPAVISVVSCGDTKS
ncbi:hypothetical protein [Vibrio paucivorans]